MFGLTSLRKGCTQHTHSHALDALVAVPHGRTGLHGELVVVKINKTRKGGILIMGQLGGGVSLEIIKGQRTAKEKQDAVKHAALRHGEFVDTSLKAHYTKQKKTSILQHGCVFLTSM